MPVARVRRAASDRDKNLARRTPPTPARTAKRNARRKRPLVPSTDARNASKKIIVIKKNEVTNAQRAPTRTYSYLLVPTGCSLQQQQQQQKIETTQRSQDHSTHHTTLHYRLHVLRFLVSNLSEDKAIRLGEHRCAITANTIDLILYYNIIIVVRLSPSP